MIDDVLKETRNKMKSTLSVYEQDLQGIRSNRASTGLVDRLEVEYYGQPTELRQLANISTPEPMQILIRPFDGSAVKAIERAIMEANIGMQPNTDGTQIRLNMPPLTRERRVELIKVLHKRAEDARVSLRNIRRGAIEDMKEFEREKMISEDDLEHGESEVQKLIEQFSAQVDELTKNKEKEMMEV
ncbi:MAG: ribosome recycling factor [Chloroflexi bacterium]|jgi:ribosome recycling factor|nr:ribosome recycling factor [Chloroflexota bacterium]MCO6445991.1 ribosome recycling factor [Anaerolineae bacterium]MDL1916720.1 ribosome recycling factor [Anaerolineae bacterium CFX4]OQY82842.1 MAG: ribosome recycling factor [Anaerolineae bacterium UTCFX5]MCC6564670.1 ribosome recycling factor [Chloroflexota bacterium]